MSEPMSDIIRLPNGKTVTRSLARARGWIDLGGNLTTLAPRNSVEQEAIEKRRREAEWRRRQGLDAPPEDSPEEATALSGQPARRVVEPLRPQNVTPEGEPVTDEVTLKEIETKTAIIESAT